MATRSSILAWRIPMDRGTWQTTVHGITESDMTELCRKNGSNKNSCGMNCVGIL